jgi:hypothetical protein
MKKNYIPSAILEKIKNDVKLELSINYSENNEVSNNLLQNSVEPQSLQSLSNHNDSFCSILDSPNNTIQTDIRLASKKNGNCQKKFCQILLNFYSLKRLFRI